MREDKELEIITSKRILLARATIFLIMPVFWLVLDKALNGKYLEDPMLLIYITFAAAVFMDRVFVKIINTRSNSN